MAATGKVYQNLRTATANSAPASGSLLPGQLSIEMNSTPVRLWAGVDTAIDATGRRLVVDSSIYALAGGGQLITTSDTAPSSPAQGDLWYDTTAQILKVWNGSAWVAAVDTDVSGFLPLAGGTLTGPLRITGPRAAVSWFDVNTYAEWGWKASNGVTRLTLSSAGAADLDVLRITGYLGAVGEFHVQGAVFSEGNQSALSWYDVNTNAQWIWRASTGAARLTLQPPGVEVLSVDGTPNLRVQGVVHSQGPSSAFAWYDPVTTGQWSWSASSGICRLVFGPTGDTLRIHGSDNALHALGGVFSDGAASSFVFYDPVTTAQWYWYASSGMARLRVVSLPGDMIWIDGGGNMNVAGVVTPSASDTRMKEAVEPYSSGLDAIMTLNPISWQWNGKGRPNRDDRKRYVGISADEAEPVLPYAVGTRPPFNPDDDPDYKTLDYQPVTAALVNAVKELAERVATLETNAGSVRKPRSSQRKR